MMIVPSILEFVEEAGFASRARLARPARDPSHRFLRQSPKMKRQVSSTSEPRAPISRHNSERPRLQASGQRSHASAGRPPQDRFADNSESHGVGAPQSKAMLEVKFADEGGFGDGVTQSFYTAVSAELSVADVGGSRPLCGLTGPMACMVCERPRGRRSKDMPRCSIGVPDGIKFRRPGWPKPCRNRCRNRDFGQFPPNICQARAFLGASALLWTSSAKRAQDLPTWLRR